MGTGNDVLQPGGSAIRGSLALKNEMSRRPNEGEKVLHLR